MTDGCDPIAETMRIMKCAGCGKPTTFVFLHPFNKTEDRPLCLKCAKRELRLLAYLNQEFQGTVDRQD